MTPRTRLVGRQAHGSAQGLTLLELLLVLVLMSVVFALVIPGFVGLAGRNELISGAEQVRTAIARARSDAMRTGQTRLIIYSPGSGFYAEVAEPLDPAAESELAAVTAFIRQADDLLRSGRDVAASPPSGLRAVAWRAYRGTLCSSTPAALLIYPRPSEAAVIVPWRWCHRDSQPVSSFQVYGWQRMGLLRIICWS